MKSSSYAHLLRDLRSVPDADPDGQLWATAMANTLIDAHHTAQQARERGATALDAAVLAAIRNHYRGALARGETTTTANAGHSRPRRER
jgi:transposase